MAVRRADTAAKEIAKMGHKKKENQLSLIRACYTIENSVFDIKAALEPHIINQYQELVLTAGV